MDDDEQVKQGGMISPALAHRIVESAMDYAIFTMDREGAITAWSPGAERILGYSAPEALQMNFDTLFVEADRIAGKPRLELDGAFRSGRAEDTRWHLRKGGKAFWANGVTIRLEGRSELVKMVRDETRAKLAEDRRILLLNELNHRIKNTLATVHAITDHTLRASHVDSAVRETLTARLIALGEAHSLLLERSWAGADLAAIITRAVSPHEAGRGERFDVAGPTVLLSAQQAVPMALVLHELTTNAVKYGALSAEQGRVSVTWNLSYDNQGARNLTLLWRERGGPPVTPPTRQGFGSRLLARSFEQAGGSVVVHYQPEGVSCVLDVRLSTPEELPVLDPPAQP